MKLGFNSKPYLKLADKNGGWNYEIDNRTLSVYNISNFYGWHTDRFD